MDRREFLIGSAATIGCLLLPSPAFAKVPFPQIELFAEDGSTFPVKNLFGKPILFNFWTPMCTPCLEEIPDLNEIDRNVVKVVGLVDLSSQDFLSQRYKEWVKKVGITYDNFCINNQYSVIFQRLFNNNPSYPAFSLVDSHGNHIWGSSGKITEGDVRRIKANLLY